MEIISSTWGILYMRHGINNKGNTTKVWEQVHIDRFFSLHIIDYIYFRTKKAFQNQLRLVILTKTFD